MSVRVLVVDDSAAFGRVMKQALESIPGVEVVSVCRSGAVALDRLRSEHPDLVTLDVEMPEMSGLEVLQAMRADSPKLAVIMVSGATDRARELTLRALELGALEFLPKPQGPESLESLRERLTPLLAAVAHRKEVTEILHGIPAKPEPPLPAWFVPPDAQTAPVPQPPAGPPPVSHSRVRKSKPAMVLIGVSTGGPEALGRLIPKLPDSLRVPVLIVQHMPPLFTQTLAQKLDSCSQIRVKEAADGEVASRGYAYIAPGGKHLKVRAGLHGEIVLRTTSDPPENNCRPAVDVLFRSAAAAFPGLSVAVILTGMGRDGTQGLRELRGAGVVAIAQDEASCTVFGMPKEAIHAGLVDIVSPLGSIASEIVRAVA
jgi:two-component system chemotaxis response regulator CheB